MGRVEYWNDPAAPKPNNLVPACGVLAVDDQGRVLLQRRRDTGQWAIPMGKQELGETPGQCAIRETQEETGVLTSGARIDDPAAFVIRLNDLLTSLTDIEPAE